MIIKTPDLQLTNFAAKSSLTELAVEVLNSDFTEEEFTDLVNCNELSDHLIEEIFEKIDHYILVEDIEVTVELIKRVLKELGI